jgi:hypothetical protein
MTEYELTDAIVSHSVAAMTAMTLYLTAVSAYLVAAFVAGSRLSGIQVSIVNALFLFVASFFTYGTAGYFNRQLYYAGKLAALVPDDSIIFNIETIVFIATVELLGIVASLYFMWSIRHPKTE